VRLATMLQARYRGYKARQHVAQLRAERARRRIAVLRIQRRMRGVLARARAARLRRIRFLARMATRIQAWWRGRSMRMVYKVRPRVDPLAASRPRTKISRGTKSS
jgi:hypothetical protein